MTHEQKTQAAVSSLPFEQAMAELEGIVRKLESGQGNLEEAITSYERGVALKAHCDSKLKDARLRVEKIVKNSQGETGVEAFEES